MATAWRNITESKADIGRPLGGQLNNADMRWWWLASRWEWVKVAGRS